jgi:Leucine-rich repeat (LRR) protein
MLVGKDVAHLVSLGSYKNFHARLRARYNAECQAAFVYGNLDRNMTVAIGNLVNVAKTGALGFWAGVKTDWVSPYEKELVPPETWFDLEVVVRGKRIVVKVNGEITAEQTLDELPEQAVLRLSTHTAGQRLDVEKIEIRELPPEETLRPVQTKPATNSIAAQQVDEVRKELQRLNPSFDGQVGHRIEDDVVVELSFVTDQVTDISPVRALTGLKTLSCSGSDVGLGQLSATALLPLKGLPLTQLDLRDSPAVSDLAALAGMKLISLDCRATSVGDADLKHLAGMKDLQMLSLWGTKVTDAGLKELAGLKNLQHLSLQATTVTDAGLKEIVGLDKLVYLDLYAVSGVTDAGLEHLARLKTLKHLDLRGPTVKDADVDKLASARPALRIVTWERVIEPKVVPFTDADAERIAALPAAEQVEEVRKELMRLNPAFDGKLTPTIENDVVTELSVNTDQVVNIAPVRALTKLAYLDCRGTYPNKGILSDLSPIKGMKLSHIDCSSTQIDDLTPLADMPLTNLQFNHNPVHDLTPLQKMPLETLGCAETKVTDFSPLKGLKLKVLGAQLLAVTDLSPLEGMPLTGIDLYHTVGVSSLAPLKGMPLEGLNLQDVPVSDLSPLAEMTTLRTLLLQGTKVSDLSPLTGLKLTDLFLRDKQITDLSPLKGQPLSRLGIDGSGVSDVTPLQGMPLAELWLDAKNITQGIDVLREMKSLKLIGIAHDKAWSPAEFWERYDKGEFKE